MLSIFYLTNVSVGANNPIWVYTVCQKSSKTFQQTTKKTTTFVVIDALGVKVKSQTLFKADLIFKDF